VGHFDSDLTAWPVTLERVSAVGVPRRHLLPGHGAVVGAEFVRLQQPRCARL
jgi:hypothetical protein